MKLDPRQQTILQTVVEIYVDTGHPVSSGAVARRAVRLGLSSATIRNVMVRLEKSGHLKKAHASAGRAPTDLGLRCYVDTTLSPRLHPWDRTNLEAATRESEPDVFTHTLGQRLAAMTGQMAVVAIPRFLGTRVREVGLTRIGAGRLVAHFVSPSGLVQQKLVEIDADLSPTELIEIQNYLNDKLARRSLAEVRRLIERELTHATSHRDALRRTALEIGRQALPDEEIDLLVEGASHLVSNPEFDAVTLQRLLTAIEEKRCLLMVLSRILDGQGVQVVLGSEHHVTEIDDLSCVGESWTDAAGNNAAAITLMGPARMDYERLIPLVHYATELFGRYWKQL